MHYAWAAFGLSILCSGGCAHPLRSCASTVLVIGPADLSLLCPPGSRPVVAALELLELHGPDGQAVWINVAEISALRQPTAIDLAKHFAPGTRCIISTTNGKFVAAIETCPEIRDRLLGGRARP